MVKRITVTVSDEFHYEIKLQAAKEGMTISDKLRETLKRWVETDWISVTDRLPPDAEEVWAYDAREGVVLATHGRYGWCDVYGDDDGLREPGLYQVTHWMPTDKPDPPPSES